MNETVTTVKGKNSKMKRMLRSFLFAVGLLVIALAWPNSKPSNQLLADGYEGDAACQECLNSALQARDQCYGIYGEGDADCNAAYDYNVSACQRQYCIMLAQK